MSLKQMRFQVTSKLIRPNNWIRLPALDKTMVHYRIALKRCSVVSNRWKRNRPSVIDGDWTVRRPKFKNRFNADTL